MGKIIRNFMQNAAAQKKANDAYEKKEHLARIAEAKAKPASKAIKSAVVAVTKKILKKK
jgi:hypothetical protein